MSKKIGVIGAGAWGSALAHALSAGGKDVTLWAREENVADALRNTRENSVFLPGVKLDSKMKFTSDLSGICKSTDILLIVTPAQHVRATLELMKKDLTPEQPIVICAKGIELESGKLLSEIAQEVLPSSPVAFLTGPS